MNIQQAQTNVTTANSSYQTKFSKSWTS